LALVLLLGSRVGPRVAIGVGLLEHIGLPFSKENVCVYSSEHTHSTVMSDHLCTLVFGANQLRICVRTALDWWPTPMSLSRDETVSKSDSVDSTTTCEMRCIIILMEPWPIKHQVHHGQDASVICQDTSEATQLSSVNTRTIVSIDTICQVVTRVRPARTPQPVATSTQPHGLIRPTLLTPHIWHAHGASHAHAHSCLLICIPLRQLLRTLRYAMRRSWC